MNIVVKVLTKMPEIPKDTSERKLYLYTFIHPKLPNTFNFILEPTIHMEGHINKLQLKAHVI